MKFLGFYVILIGFVLAQLCPATAAQLVSIQGIDFNGDDGGSGYVWHFEVEVKHGRILALCRVLDGWDIKIHDYAEAGDYKTGGAHIEGDAEFGHNAFTQNTLDRLQNLFLIDDVTPAGHQPVSFSGSVTVNFFGDDPTKKQKLVSKNFILTPATLCPAPYLQ